MQSKELSLKIIILNYNELKIIQQKSQKFNRFNKIRI